MAAAIRARCRWAPWSSRSSGSAGNGYAEIVLTGVDMTSFGADLPGSPKLGKLVKTILKQVPDVKRLRLSSIDSIEADDDLLDAIATEPRLMPHLHLSLQSGDDMILKRMKRRHLRDQSIRFCEDVRKLRPGIVFGADIIAGFPTETDDMFENSEKIVEECGLTHLHVFPFSPREGTPAARMPQVRRELVKQRAARLRAAGEAAYRRHLSSLSGTRQSILIERDGLGRTEGFTLAALGTGAPGEIVEADITGHDGIRLIAAPACRPRRLRNAKHGWFFQEDIFVRQEGSGRGADRRDRPAAADQMGSAGCAEAGGRAGRSGVFEARRAAARGGGRAVASRAEPEVARLTATGACRGTSARAGSDHSART